MQTTGHGEFFIRAVVAYDISCLIEYKGLSLTEACEFVVNDKLKKFSGEGGLVALNTNGDCVLAFNSDGMYRAWKTSENKKGVELFYHSFTNLPSRTFPLLVIASIKYNPGVKSEVFICSLYFEVVFNLPIES